MVRKRGRKREKLDARTKALEARRDIPLLRQSMYKVGTKITNELAG